MVVLASAPVDQVPCVARAPLQPPEAVHPVALSEFQLRLDMPPAATVVGDAVRVTVGVAEVGTLVWVAARVTAGFAAVTEVGSVVVVWPVADCWQAAKAEKDAQTMSQADRREAARPRSVVAVERSEHRMLSNEDRILSNR